MRVVDVTTGAVNNPPLVMLPALAAQVTAELLVLLTVAVNCCFEPETRTKALGEILSCVRVDCACTTVGAPLVEAPQPTEIRAAISTGTIARPLE